MFTKFNRVLLASGLVLTSLVGFGSAAFADDDPDDTLGVSGEIVAAQNLAITEDADSFTITANSSSDQIFPSVGTVTASTNVTWKIKASSASNGYLAISGADEESEKIAYELEIANPTVGIQGTLGYKGLVGSLTAPVDLFDGGTDSSTGITSAVMNLKIPANGASGKKADFYADTITLTIYPK